MTKYDLMTELMESLSLPIPTSMNWSTSYVKMLFQGPLEQIFGEKLERPEDIILVLKNLGIQNNLTKNHILSPIGSRTVEEICVVMIDLLNLLKCSRMNLSDFFENSELKHIQTERINYLVHKTIKSSNRLSRAPPSTASTNSEYLSSLRVRLGKTIGCNREGLDNLRNELSSLEAENREIEYAPEKLIAAKRDLEQLNVQCEAAHQRARELDELKKNCEMSSLENDKVSTQINQVNEENKQMNEQYETQFGKSVEKFIREGEALSARRENFEAKIVDVEAEKQRVHKQLLEKKQEMHAVSNRFATQLGRITKLNIEHYFSCDIRDVCSTFESFLVDPDSSSWKIILKKFVIETTFIKDDLKSKIDTNQRQLDKVRSAVSILEIDYDIKRKENELDDNLCTSIKYLKPTRYCAEKIDEISDAAIERMKHQKEIAQKAINWKKYELETLQRDFEQSFAAKELQLKKTMDEKLKKFHEKRAKYYRVRMEAHKVHEIQKAQLQEMRDLNARLDKILEN